MSDPIFSPLPAALDYLGWDWHELSKKKTQNKGKNKDINKYQNQKRHDTELQNHKPGLCCTWWWYFCVCKEHVCHFHRSYPGETHQQNLKINENANLTRG